MMLNNRILRKDCRLLQDIVIYAASVRIRQYPGNHVFIPEVGYGDIYPVTTAGRIITMLSSVLGIAIVALPAGIITAEYLDELNDDKKDDK